MSEQDKFARIAFETQTISKDDVVEIPPPSYNKKDFLPTDIVVSPITIKSYEEQLDDFKNELAELREKHSPFLRDLVPPVKTNRNRKELKDFLFRFEQSEDKLNFTRLQNGEGEWEQISIPHYHGPIGKWTSWYRTEFNYDSLTSGKRLFIKFLGVDYQCCVYLNGRCVGSHEGFFAPFEFDITDYILHNQPNILLIQVDNDMCMIDGDGEKIYAATGLGWDDPKVGWHHCPAGAGIYNKVILEERPELFIYDSFVRPLCDESTAGAWIELYNTNKDIKTAEVCLQIFPRNFEGEPYPETSFKTEQMGLNWNYYRFHIPLEGFEWWTPDSPKLYTLRVTLKQNDVVIDTQDCVFGMRSFRMDADSEPKGRLYLNNEPIILRGANDMGHMQQCVLNEDWDQLIDDILIAKLANMNYYRFTQRPVQKEIYNYCDMLGMMNQTDLPLFGFLRRNQFEEAVRQSGEMERLIRSNPSSIMVSYINEPFHTEIPQWGHRHLYRDDLEAFFDSASRVINLHNPDRVIKNCEGDYDPPTKSGLADFHCYTLWYTNHAIPVGKLHKGYIPPILKGWLTGCGEYGAEGLDPLEIMLERYPKEWLPEKIDDKWDPQNVIQSQSFSMHGDWYELQTNIKGWIDESQKHQAFATKILTDALRFRSDYVIQTALHLLIDAWPSGWMKTVVDCNRKPKPAYFEFQNSLKPVKIHLRTDKFRYYYGDTIQSDVWILNDTSKSIDGCELYLTLRDDNHEYGSLTQKVDVNGFNPTYVGSTQLTVPQSDERKLLFIDAELKDSGNTILDKQRLELEAFPRLNLKALPTIEYLGDNEKNILTMLNIPCKPFFDENAAEVLIVEGKDAWLNNKTAIYAKKYKRILLLLDSSLMGITDTNVTKVDGMNGVFFLARNNGHPITAEFKADDFRFIYNSKLDYIDFTSECFLNDDELTPLLYTYQKPGFADQQRGDKRILSVVGSKREGDTELVISVLPLDGRVGHNPTLDKLFYNVLFKL